jgi:hypothetical protein
MTIKKKINTGRKRKKGKIIAEDFKKNIFRQG